VSRLRTLLRSDSFAALFYAATASGLSRDDYFRNVGPSRLAHPGRSRNSFIWWSLLVVVLLAVGLRRRRRSVPGRRGGLGAHGS
jgi:hypothetical protein